MQTLHQRPVDLDIIIPVYNLEKFLQPMLESLKAQDYGDYHVEILFVLNNCTDNSEGVIRDSGLPCRIINCTTQGCGPARNAGLEITTGQYVWFMDGDDWLLYNTAVRDALDVAQGRDIIWTRYESDTFRRQYFSMVWQYVISRQLIGGTRFPNYQPSEDDAFMLEILKKVGFDPYTYTLMVSTIRPLYYYNYFREGSNMYRWHHGEKI